jgi:hypothetical protein
LSNLHAENPEFAAVARPDDGPEKTPKWQAGERNHVDVPKYLHITSLDFPLGCTLGQAKMIGPARGKRKSSSTSTDSARDSAIGFILPALFGLGVNPYLFAPFKLNLLR